ncbi:hypothetical protein AB0M43_14305 [Longispora sp. NPDC051575]|uniref:hypothetical protein n=1 Tax=Longispora sp. NPDC051575 TaxID=3154943 RepID=UPI00343B4FC9
MTEILYPAYRAVEVAAGVPGARPLRLLSMLLPVWRVEVATTVREAQPYEVFDRFLARGIDQAGLDTPASLALFFGVEASLVERAVGFLTTIGHVARTDDTVSLTALGRQSVRDGCRYVIKEDRTILYFDRLSGGPLPQSHYTGINYQPHQEQRGFRGLTSMGPPFQAKALDALVGRRDRAAFNLPDGLTDARLESFDMRWIPVHVVETRSDPRYFVFSGATAGRDRHLERVCNASPVFLDALGAEPAPDHEQIWRNWLDSRGLHSVRPEYAASGVLRAVLPPESFGPGAVFRAHRPGTFEPYQQSFLQLWCADERIRTRAAAERALMMLRSGAVRTAQDLDERLHHLGVQLEVRTPSPNQVWNWAAERDDQVALSALEQIF